MTHATQSTRPEQVLIEVRNFKAAYNGVTVLESLNFDIRSGEVFVILGGSGCGKSTLLKHMIGLYEPAAGEILIRGRDIVTSHGDERIEILRQIGVAYQGGALFGSMNLLENVRLPLEEYTDLPMDAMNLVARMKLKLVGLLDYAGHLPSQISGGMQKRAAIARAMALDPCTLFLDEPSAGLDPITSAELDALIVRIARGLGITFVIVTHELASIYSIADWCMMLDKRTKGVIAEGRPQQLRDQSANPWVRQFFNREIEANA